MRDDLKPGQKMIWITCQNHRRPSRLYAFYRYENEAEGSTAWEEWPITHPPATVFVNDAKRQARYQFSPELWKLDRRRPSYSLKCSRCGAGPVSLRRERMVKVLNNAESSGVSRLSLQDIGDTLNA